jgi:hypothetical protein
MTDKKDVQFRDLLGELFFIVGGFILAETIITQFISLSTNVLPWWALPSFSLLLIMAALDFRNKRVGVFKAGIPTVLYLGISIVLIVLMKNNIITNMCFLWSIFILSLVTFVVYLLFFLSANKRARR